MSDAAMQLCVSDFYATHAEHGAVPAAVGATAADTFLTSNFRFDTDGLAGTVVDTAKIEAGQIEIASAPFDVRESIQKVVETVTPLAAKKRLKEGPGTLPTHGPVFVALLMAVVLTVGALTFVPALALGPLAEHLALFARP